MIEVFVIVFAIAMTLLIMWSDKDPSGKQLLNELDGPFMVYKPKDLSWPEALQMAIDVLELEARCEQEISQIYEVPTTNGAYRATATERTGTATI